MKTLVNDDLPEREPIPGTGGNAHERDDLMHRFVRQLHEHISLFRIDDDGTLGFTSAVLGQKRGCRRR